MRPFPLLIALSAAAVFTASCRPSAAPVQPPANSTCNELSFYLDPVLGSGCECQTIPESSSSDVPMDVFIYPAHTELTIKDYPLTRTQFSPQIRVYPVERYSELLPDLLPGRLADLESLISGGTGSGRELPFLPPLPMAQSFYSHLALISFSGGQGLRYISDYNEIQHPVSSRTIFYTFQGLSADGRYWVAVTLPISSPILPEEVVFPPAPEGYTLESWFQNYSSYVSDLKGELDAQEPDSFFPTIDMLDNLVQSIEFRQ